MAARLASSDEEESQKHSQQMVAQAPKVAPHFVARLKNTLERSVQIMGLTSASSLHFLKTIADGPP